MASTQLAVVRIQYRRRGAQTAAEGRRPPRHLQGHTYAIIAKRATAKGHTLVAHCTECTAAEEHTAAEGHR